jgi:hypothetical protein
MTGWSLGYSTPEQNVVVVEMVVLVAVIVAVTLVWLGREWWWLRRVRRASGDPEQLTRLMARRRRG